MGSLSVEVRTEVLCGRICDLEAENAKLRNDADLLRAMLSQVQTEKRCYMAENAKLRELVDELYPLADYGAMDASELDRAHDLMRELGVDDG